MGRILKKPIKDILFVTVGYSLGGSEKMIQSIATILKKRGYKVRILAFKSWGEVSENLEKMNIDCVSLFGRGRLDFRVLWRYFLYLLKFPPDIIIAFLYRAYIPTRLFGWILSIPNISSVRDVQEWMNPVQKFFDRITSTFSYIIYACSEAVANFLTTDVGINPKNIVTILNGIDVNKYNLKLDRIKKKKELGLDVKKLVVGTVSRLYEPKKGIKYLLKSVKLLQGEIDFQLLIVGGGKDELILKEMADDLGINVIFLGDRKDVPEILSVMDIFVLASLYEGLPVSLLEAMACSLPVVVTGVGGIPEVVINGKTGFIVEPRNVNQLSSKLKELLIDKEKRINFGNEGYYRVKEEFSIDKTVSEIEQLWKEVKN